ncbi:ferritin-like domain-containing protein [Pseudorhodoplanes sp.]|uniref:YciE/YciF ferroxidase family protein n=1 Tax=Pseudorhodoplanes sp. TaxID=1934341 RepID=UPI003918C765
MPGQSKTLEDLFHEVLKDIYYAERKILSALPKMAKAVKSNELRAAFEKHVKETEGQVQRLQQVFKIIRQEPKGKTCQAILGLVEEGEEMIEEFADSVALDAGLIGGAQAVEHYEIARYGTLIAWAEQLGMSEVVKLLQQSLDEEKMTDRSLTKLAETAINACGMKEAAE